MNTDSLKFQISEMRVHVENCLADLQSGKIGPDDDIALSVQLGHIFWPRVLARCLAHFDVNVVEWLIRCKAASAPMADNTLLVPLRARVC